MTSPPPDRRFAAVRPATDADIRAHLSEFRSWLSQRGVADAACGAVEIALGEALNNVVEHAYAGMAPGTVALEGCHAGTTLSVTLRDTGKPLPGLTLPTGPLPAHDVDRTDLPEGGFGWFLIHELTSALAYQNIAGQNQLSMQFDISRLSD